MTTERAPELRVYLDNEPAGTLRLQAGQRFAFQYQAEWLASARALPLSVRMPLVDQEYAEEVARPFFANLLPEGEIRTAISRLKGISATNDYRLLEALGGECAGAVSLWPPGTAPHAKDGYSPLDDDQLASLLAAIPRRPLLAAGRRVRLSLAGAQQKLTVLITGDKLFLPEGGSPSNCILKPAIPGLASIVENEVFCMLLAHRSGLPVPAASIYREHNLYLVERYDRTRDRSGTLRRLHQEDFCQALGYLPQQKYEAEGGPGLKACFELLAVNSTRPLVDRLTLLRWVVFNYLIGNADAHAKNVALLIQPAGITLAPFYDLISTAVYPDVHRNMAMRIGGEKRPDWLQPRHWQRFAADIDVHPRLVVETARGLAAQVPQAAERVAEQLSTLHPGSAAITGSIGKVIARRAHRLANL